MRRTPLISAALLVASLLALPAAARPVRTVAPTPWLETSQPAGTPVTAGHGWHWTDFVYDDGGRADNAADIVRTDLRTEGHDLLVAVTLNTLRRTDHPVLGLAVSDADSVAPVRAWPGAPKVASRWQAFVTARPGAGATLDLARQQLTVRLPGWADHHAVDLNIGAGTSPKAAWDAPGVIDLAFNSAAAEPTYDKNSYRNHAQQDAIDRGDVQPFATRIDLDALRRGAPTETTWTPGTQVRVYRTVQDLGGGYGSAYPGMRGRYQPYTLYLPPGYRPDRPACLLLMLHSLNNTNNEYVGTSVYNTLAGDRGCIAITPLAKGVDGWYWDEALVDTLQVFDDVEHLLPVDRSRVTLCGYSMGGYGTYRLATLFPDLFAAGAMWAGVPAYYIWPYPAPPISTPSRQSPGMAYDQLLSTQHVPLFIAQGTHDELVPVSGPTAMARRLDDLGYTYRYDLYPGFDHFSFTYVDQWQPWRDWLGDRTRVTDPAHVALALRPESWVDSARSAADQKTMLELIRHLAGDLGSRLDGGYWVRDVATAGTGDVTATVDLTSSGIADRVPQGHPVSTTTPGPPYVIGFTVQAGPPFGHVLTGNDRTLAAAPVGNVLSGTLSNVSALTVDLSAAHLHLRGLSVKVTTSTPTRLTLVEGTTSRVVQLQP